MLGLLLFGLLSNYLDPYDFLQSGLVFLGSNSHYVLISKENTPSPPLCAQVTRLDMRRNAVPNKIRPFNLQFEFPVLADSCCIFAFPFIQHGGIRRPADTGGGASISDFNLLDNLFGM